MDQSTHSEPCGGTSARTRDSEIRLHELQSLCSHKDAVIRSLHREVEVGRRERAAESLLVEVKTAKIKEWLATRLRELEEQNERLRNQNLKCTRQLEVLRTCADNAAMWRSSVFENTTEASMQASTITASTRKNSDDDSGTTSDVPSSVIDDSLAEFPESFDQKQTVSFERVLADKSNFHSLPWRNSTNRMSRSLQGSSGSDRTQTRTFAITGRVENRRSRSIDRDSLNSNCFVHKPKPTPRRRASKQLEQNRLLPENGSVGNKDERSLAIPYAMSSNYATLDCGRLNSFPTQANLLNMPNGKRIAALENRLAAMVKFENGAVERSSQVGWTNGIDNTLNSVKIVNQKISASSENLPLLSLMWVQQQQEKAASPLSCGTGHGSGSSNAATFCVECDSNGSLNSQSSSIPSISRQNFQSVLPKSGASQSDDDDDYAVPPDATNFSNSPLRLSGRYTQTVPRLPSSTMDSYGNLTAKSGYVSNLGDRMKSLRRRWLIIRHDQLLFYKSSGDVMRGKPLMTLPLHSIISVSKITSGSSCVGFELKTPKESYKLTSDSSASNEDWVKALRKCIDQTMKWRLSHLPMETRSFKLCGWLTKIKRGRCKNCWAVLIDRILAFYKDETRSVACGQIQLVGAVINEAKPSSDDSSGDDSDDRKEGEIRSKPKPSACIAINLPDQDAIYLSFADDVENLRKWLFFLSFAASDTGDFRCTAIEQLALADDDPPDRMWNDSIFTDCESQISASLVSLGSVALEKKAIELYKLCYMFASVPIDAAAADYHIDLAQTIIGQVLNEQELQDEFICQLIKLTLTSVTSLQAWLLLATALPLFVPKKYPVMWLLRKHLCRIPKSSKFAEIVHLAKFCENSLNRSAKRDGRSKLSRFEALCIFTRRHYMHSKPFSLPVHLPDQSYKLVAFDGSSTVGECLESLCRDLGIEDFVRGGMALYADDPQDATAMHCLNAKEKILCEVIAEFEHNLMENRTGKFPSNRIIKLMLRRRFVRKSHLETDSVVETLLFAHQLHTDIQMGRFPVGDELLVELTAIMCQIVNGDLVNFRGKINEALKSYGAEFVGKQVQEDCWNGLEQKWADLRGLSSHDCGRLYISALCKYPWFGCNIYSATMRLRGEKPVLLVANRNSISIFAQDTKNLIASYPYDAVLSFGGFKSDFMLAIRRPYYQTCDSDGCLQERLTFAMKKSDIADFTMLVAGYIQHRIRNLC